MAREDAYLEAVKRNWGGGLRCDRVCVLDEGCDRQSVEHPGLTCMCRRQENLVNPEGELGGGYQSKSCGYRQTFACHSIYPTGFLKQLPAAKPILRREVIRIDSHLRVRTICATNVQVTKVKIGTNDALLHL